MHNLWDWWCGFALKADYNINHQPPDAVCRGLEEWMTHAHLHLEQSYRAAAAAGLLFVFSERESGQNPLRGRAPVHGEVEWDASGIVLTARERIDELHPSCIQKQQVCVK